MILQNPMFNAVAFFVCCELIDSFCIICLIVWVSVSSRPSNSFLHSVHQRHTSLWHLGVGQVPASYDPVLSVHEGTMIPAAKENRLLYSALQAKQAECALFEIWSCLITNVLTKVTTTKDSLSILGVKFATMWRRRGTFWNELGRNRKIYSRLK